MNPHIRRWLVAPALSLGLNKVFWRIYRLLGEPEPPLTPWGGGPVFGHFTDSQGHRYDLHHDLRSRLKPGWEDEFRPPLEILTAPPKAVRVSTLQSRRRQVAEVERFLNAQGVSLMGRDVVEIGGYDGAAAYAMAQFGAGNVTATDMATAYIQGGIVTPEGLQAMARARAAFAGLVERDAARRVSFAEDDICASALAEESADVVVSWEVLEHLERPLDAFQSIARILRRGGVAFHEYNPFFAINGGHSLCTLDFLWGHARLSAPDFERYVAEIRPQEAELALSFYAKGLNRMTLAALRRHVQESGLCLLCVVPFPDRRSIGALSSDVLKDVTRHYPCADALDLISPKVWVLLRKARDGT